MPCIWMLIEYPFNMIPFDWPMLFFVESLFTLYIVVIAIVQVAEEDHINVYAAFDWYGHPGKAVLWLFVCYAFVTAIFGVFWFLTMRIKLPKYDEMVKARFSSGIHAFS